MEVCTDRQHLINKTQHFATAKKKGAVNMAIEKGLLIHWWHYYGKVIYTLAELEEFEKVIDEYGADKVLDVALMFAEMVLQPLCWQVFGKGL